MGYLTRPQETYFFLTWLDPICGDWEHGQNSTARIQKRICRESETSVGKGGPLFQIPAD